MEMQEKELNILFIEDTPEDVELAVIELNRQGFDIKWERVDSEPSLRAILKRWRPDIILSDHQMPSFNGLAALAITQELTPEIPFIFVSGTIGEERAIDSIHKGATDYVLKDNLRRLSTSVNRAVTESIDRQRALEIEKDRSRLAAILESTSDLVVMSDPDGTILYINQGARGLLGLGKRPDKITIKDLFAEWVWDFIVNELSPTVIRDGIWQGESVLAASDGAEIPVSMVVISHTGENNEVEYFSFIARDIRDRKAYEKQIRYLANFDLLTDMPNRTLLTDRADQAIVHCKRSDKFLAVFVINIDRFKLVNDGYGQEVGDSLLKQFGLRLQAAVRTGDTIARLSADSFAVLATELSSPDDAIYVVRKIQEAIKVPFNFDGINLNVTTGIGISIYPKDGDDFNTLLQNADVAMHRSKDQGDSGLQFYATEMTRNASERVILENELRKALVNNELELYYQPQIDLNDDRIVAFEALMRWNHPDKGLISPGLFIPIAENTELISPMGEWALNQACVQLKEWREQGKQGLRVSVNVSARQFRAHGFADMVGRIVNTSGLEAGSIEIELTESVLIHDREEAVKVLTQLDGLGVKIALDDFGTGYSNLSYLSRLPIHYLKIDQSFVNRCLEDNNDSEIVRAIISLSDLLGLGVIAEGIETEEQLEFLKKHDCDMGQGYLFSRPLPADKISGFMSKYSAKSQDNNKGNNI